MLRYDLSNNLSSQVRLGYYSPELPTSSESDSDN